MRRAGGSGEEVRDLLRRYRRSRVGGLRGGTEDQESRGIRREGASGGLPEDSGGVGGSSEGDAGAGSPGEPARVARGEAGLPVQNEGGAVPELGQGSGKRGEHDGRRGDEVVRSSGAYRDEEAVVVAGDGRHRVRGRESAIRSGGGEEGVRIRRGSELPFQPVLGERIGELGPGGGVQGLGSHAYGVGDP